MRLRRITLLLFHSARAAGPEFHTITKVIAFVIEVVLCAFFKIVCSCFSMIFQAFFGFTEDSAIKKDSRLNCLCDGFMYFTMLCFFYPVFRFVTGFHRQN